MNKSTFRIVIAMALVGLALYEAFKESWWEVAFYLIAAGAFATMAWVPNVKNPKWTGPINALSWILIIASVLFFVFLVRTDG
jgi:hypothetical protein